MKKIMYCGILFVGLFAFCQPSEAVPANSEVVTFEQPSGETFKGQLKGDESLNYFVTERGEVIEKNEKDNYWYYLEKNTNRSTSEGTKAYTVKVGDKVPNNVINEELFIQTTPKNETFIEQETVTPKARTMQKNEHNLLVLLVEFDDVKLKYSDNEWEKLIFGNEAPSLKNYYTTNAKGRIEVVPAKETSDTSNDGIIRVRLEGNHPNTAGKIDERNQEITKQALIKAQSFVDYKQYDTNGNGKLEADELHIMVIVAGQEASYSYANDKTVWGHKWSLQNQQSLTLDGLKFRTYTQFGEIHYNHQATLGVIAHEFGHDLGLPDLYNTGFMENNVTIKQGVGLGYTSLMALGSWGRRSYNEDAGTTPVGLDAYSKSILGMDVETIITSANDKSVQTLDEGEPTILRVNSKNNNEYFLMENRQFSGYDEGMSLKTYSGGIAIYRVNTEYVKNYTKGKQLVTSVEADEGIRGYSYFSQNEMFNSADPFYYNGTGLHGKGQQVVLSKKTAPSTILSDGSTENFKFQVKSNPENKMCIDLQMIEPVEGTFGTTSWEWDEETQTVTFGEGKFPASNRNSNIKTVIEGDPVLKGKKIRKIIFTEPIIMNENSSHLFSNLYELEMTEQASLLEMSKVKNASYLFATDNFESTLKQLDVSSWDTSNMTDMESMFGGQSCLEQLDVSKWDTSNVTNMSYLFYLTKGLKGLDVSKWDTSNVTDMSYLFYVTEGLKSIDVSKWETSNVIDMTGLFAYSGMESLAVDKWETSNVVNMTAVFGGTKLSTVDVSKWDTSNVTDMSSLFSSSSISTLDISKWDTSKVETFDSMFAYMNNLISLDLSNFDLSSVKKDGLAFMFRSNKGLKNLDVSNWDVSRSNKFLRLFTDCSSLESIDLSSWDMRGEVYPFDGWAMFMNMASLNTIILGENNRFSPDTFLPEKSEEPYTGTWVLQSGDNKYSSSKEFMSNYDGSKPGTYVREKNDI